MKNKSKKIPKTHLPKYGNGGDATSNLYNDKRSNSLTTDQKNSIYSTLGAAGTSYAMSNNQAAYSDPNYQMNNSSKGAWQSQGGAEGTADSIQSGVASAIPQAALFHGISESAQSAVGTQGANAGAQYFFEPHKLITHAIDGEGLFNAKDREEHGLGKLNGGIRFPNGGMNIIPNAEIEKQENVVAPNGGFLQADGPSHEQGGVPVALPGNSMIFSDRLKLGKKTFAELNKVNNTSKEDKILESNKFGNTSKRTAELMKFAKNKNSQELFNAQEALKQAKVEAYAKKMGVNLNLSPEVPQEFAMGGVKLPMYPLGGPTDNTKFTPAQRQQAYADSMTLYKSGFNKNIPNWQAEPGFNDAVGRLHTLNGVVPQSTDKSATAYANDPNYLAKRSVPYAKPTRPVYEVKTEGKNAFVPTYPNYNMPMKGLERPDDFNPQLQTVPANRPSTIKTNIVTGPTMSYKEYKQGNEVLDRAYFDPSTKKEIETQGFKYGGRKLPKYWDGGESEDNPLGYKPTNKVDQMRMQQALWNSQNKSSSSSWLTPEMMQTSSDALIEEGYTNPNSPVINTTPTANTYPIRRDKNGKLIFDTPTSPTSSVGTKRDQELYDAELARMNASGGRDSNKFNWKNTLGQVSNFAGQNMGNIYDLSRKDAPLQKYDRATASYLDATAAMRDAEAQTRRAEYNVRGASGGNAGTYLSNRVALNAQNTINKDRIRQEYANANAQIGNQNAQFNAEIAYREAEARAKDAAMKENIRSQAIHSIGSNFGKMTKSGRQDNIDQDTLKMFQWRYKNEPGFKKYIDNFSTQNNSGEAIV